MAGDHLTTQPVPRPPTTVPEHSKGRADTVYGQGSWTLRHFVAIPADIIELLAQSSSRSMQLRHAPMSDELSDYRVGERRS